MPNTLMTFAAIGVTCLVATFPYPGLSQTHPVTGAAMPAGFVDTQIGLPIPEALSWTKG